MNKESNSYIIIFSLIMVVIVAASLAMISYFLSPKQERNKEIEKKLNILKSLNIYPAKDSVELLYNKVIISSLVVDKEGNTLNSSDAFEINLRQEFLKSDSEQRLPVFIADINGEKKYIFSLLGKGLWGEISGFVTTNDDFNEIYGIVFNHAAETPGLGSEISDLFFQQQFIGKKIFDDSLQSVDLHIIKNKKNDDTNNIDAISGATLTSNGVHDMLHNCMTAYLEFINNEKNY